MSSTPQPNTGDGDELEVAVDQAVAACDGDMRSAVRALIPTKTAAAGMAPACQTAVRQERSGDGVTKINMP
jgi:hypothetical protein